MKSFRQYLREHPHETESPVPVTTYLPRRPSLHPDLVIRLRQEVYDGEYSTVESRLPIGKLIPMQATVSQPKVMTYTHNNLASTKLPIVLHAGLSDYLIVDGHHRICGEAVAGKSLVTCRVIQGADAHSLGITYH